MFSRSIDKQIEKIRQKREKEDGPKAAAWLIGSQRKSFLRTGYCDWTIPADKMESLPIWFSVAITHLVKRGKARKADKKRKKWVVEITQNAQVKQYRVRWMDWGGLNQSGILA